MTTGDKNIPAAPAAGGVDSLLQNTQAFLDLIVGDNKTTSSSGGSKTTQTDVSGAGIAELMRQMMEGTGGLADVATGSHVAGLYNDSTKTLLVQNLLTKIAGQAALANAKTTTTTSPESSSAKVAPKLTGTSAVSSLALAGITAAAGKYAKKSGLLKALGLDDDAGTVASPAAGSAPGVTSIQNITDTSPAGAASDTQADLGTMGGNFAEQIPNVTVPLVGTDDMTSLAAPVADLSDTSSGVGDAFASDVIPGEDLTLGASDIFDTGGSAAVDSLTGGGDFLSSILGFKRGGMVGGRKNSSTRMGYAEGGLVNVNKGTPDPIVPARPVTDPVTKAVANPPVLPVQTAGGKKAGGTSDAGDGSGGGSGGGSNPAANTLQTASAPFSFSQAAQIGLGILGFMANPVMGTLNAASLMSTGKSTTSNVFDKVTDAFGFGSSPVESIGGGMTGGISAGAGQSHAELSTDPAPASMDISPTTTDTPADIAPSIGPSSDIGPGKGEEDTDTTGGAPPGGGMSDAGSGTGEAQSESSGGVEVGVGGDGAEPGAPGFADGGAIRAPGDGTEDTRFIKAADGEFIINAQAAKAIGIDKLTWLNSVLGGRAA